MTLLALKDVSKSFLDGAREFVVLDGVSVEFGARELVGIYGERRSGKSTLLTVAAGLEIPDEGVVSFQGEDIAKLSFKEGARRRRRHGLAFLSGDWRPERADQPAIEHVALPLTSGGLTLAEAEVPARQVLDRFGVTRWAHVSTDRLSAGERIRVDLARAVAGEPLLLLVDEPAVLSGPGESRDLYGLLHSLAREMTVVIASEDIEAISGVDRFMTIDDGTLRSNDSRKRVLPFPQRRRAGNGSSAS